MSFFRSACHEERGNLRLLPRALPGYHLRRENPAQNPLLLLQPHRALSSHRLHGRPWLHPAPGLRREALSGWVFLREKPLFLLIPSEKSRQCAQVGQSISVRPCQSICPTEAFQQHFHVLSSTTTKCVLPEHKGVHIVICVNKFSTLENTSTFDWNESFFCRLDRHIVVTNFPNRNCSFLPCEHCQSIDRWWDCKQSFFFPFWITHKPHQPCIIRGYMFSNNYHHMRWISLSTKWTRTGMQLFRLGFSRVGMEKALDLGICTIL